MTWNINESSSEESEAVSSWGVVAFIVRVADFCNTVGECVY